MKKKEVPQDEGLSDGLFEDICYALDDDGHYVVVPTTGFQPKTDALLQAWDVIHEKIEEVRQLVLAGKLSPIAYFMEKNIMDARLLADYMGIPKWKVKRHLKPKHFNKLDDDILDRYAETFNINREQLKDISVIQEDKNESK
ncbi:MAG TPA: hypothetical protein PLW31_00795 [Bacteroidales bacterium]|nr:hypothetical protein [Bacteroidales bacterium]HPI85967.1 hypothetical protein [Bacteroidales bacterium]HPM92579.1 hypothetical protein [Bacteroidales bacterium]